MSDALQRDQQIKAKIAELPRYKSRLTSYHEIPNGVWTEMVSGDVEVEASKHEWIRADDLERLLSVPSAPREPDLEREDICYCRKNPCECLRHA